MYLAPDSDPFLPGDHLRVARPWSIFPHDGIYEGNGYVIQAEKGKFVERVPLEVFAGGSVPELVYRPKTWLAAQVIVFRARRRLGQPYDALIANCQHLANEAITGRAYSQTVTGLVVLGFVGGIIALANRKG
jgi:hypothetical protein